MQGAVFVGDRKVELRDFPDPEPAPNEVVVAIRASGMCGTDLHMYRAAAGGGQAESVIAGHEPAGVVYAVGDSVSPETASVGDRVMVHHYAGCATCDHCRSGWPQMCSSAPSRVFGFTAHGGHAPFIVVPAATLVTLDPALSFEAGAAIACGTGTAWGALDRLGDLGGSTVAVFGQGPVGLSATLLATARGARVIAIDPEADRRQHAHRFGAVATVDPMHASPSKALRDMTGGVGVPLMLETSGATAAIAEGIGALAKWGRACLIGLGGEARFAVSDVLQSQVTLMTSWTMSIVQLRQCADFVVRNELPIDDLYTHRSPLVEVGAAYRNFDRQNAGKGVIVFDDPD